MKKSVKGILLILLVAIVTVVIYLNYQTYFSEAAQEGNRNIENIRKVRIGMDRDSVIIVMGYPETIDEPDYTRYPYTQFNYPTNDESFANVTVIFDSTMRVKDIYYPR